MIDSKAWHCGHSRPSRRMSSPIPDPTATTPWLVRIPDVFEGFTTEILERTGGKSGTRLGSGYHLIHLADPSSVQDSDAAMFLRWNLPLEHSWPCNPQKMDGFIEKAAQTLLRKFRDRQPQALLIGLLDPSSSNRYYKTLASNLRGRALQLFPTLPAAPNDAEAQDATKPTLYCLIGKEGLFAGMQSPQQSNGFYPGGTKFISQNAPDTISRAGAKIAEAVHYLLLHRPPMNPGSHWLELGASPGGMTSELLKRGHRVTAIDRAALDPRLDREPNLRFIHSDVASFRPPPSTTFDALLSDLNGDTLESLQQVLRLSANLTDGGLVVFTLKTAGITTFEEAISLHQEAVRRAEASGLHLIARTHLTYNRQEFTLFFERTP